MASLTPQIFIQSNGGSVQYGELVNAEVDEVVWELNAPGSAKFTMLQNDPQVIVPKPGETEAKIVIYDGSSYKRFVGPIQSCANGPLKAQFSVEGLETWFKERIVDDASLEFTSMDQTIIATNIVNFAQSEATQASRDFNIDIGSFDTTTHIRSRRWERNNHQVVFDILSEFPDLDDGFDWAVIPQDNGLREFICYYPKRGVTHTELTFEVDANGSRNVKDYTVDETAVNLATHAYVGGGTNGDVKFEQNYEDTVQSAKYRVRQRVFSEGSQKDVVWLQAKAVANVDKFGKVLVVPSITAIQAPSEILMVLNPGDYAKVRISVGRINLNALHRFVSIKWLPKADTIELKVNEQ